MLEMRGILPKEEVSCGRRGGVCRIACTGDDDKDAVNSTEIKKKKTTYSNKREGNPNKNSIGAGRSCHRRQDIIGGNSGTTAVRTVITGT